MALTLISHLTSSSSLLLFTVHAIQACYLCLSPSSSPPIVLRSVFLEDPPHFLGLRCSPLATNMPHFSCQRCAAHQASSAHATSVCHFEGPTVQHCACCRWGVSLEHVCDGNGLTGLEQLDFEKISPSPVAAGYISLRGIPW